MSTPNGGFPQQDQSIPPLPPPNQHRASAPSAISQFGRTLSQSVRQGFQTNPSLSQSPSRPLSTLSQGLALSNHAQIHHASSAPQPMLHHPSPTPTSFSGDSPTLMQITDDHYNSYTSPSATDDPNTTSTLEPMTPPTTPPMGDIRSRLSASPVSANRQSANPWKRMRYSLGWRKKSDHEHDFPGGGH